MRVLEFLLSHQETKSEWLSAREIAFELAWMDEKWWPLVTGEKKRAAQPERLNRKHFEACVFSQLLRELKSGDICIEGSLEYADYRGQLISDEEFDDAVLLDRRREDHGRIDDTDGCERDHDRNRLCDPRRGMTRFATRHG
jgi:hypothetical protein